MNETKKIKIIIVDDHPIVHKGLEMIFSTEEDLKICAVAESASRAMEYIEKYQPDLVIVDISLKGGVSGIDLIKGIRRRHPGLKMIVLSMYDESLYAERAIRAGARGYVKKEELTTAIIKAIRTVMSGNIYLNSTVSSYLIDKILFDQSKRTVSARNNNEKLTDRELEVLELIGHGYKTRDIAKKLNVSTRTIDSHRSSIKDKLELRTSAEMIKYAIDLVNND